MKPLVVFLRVPEPEDDFRRIAFSCAEAAAKRGGAVALASRWPRAGLFVLFPEGPGFASLTHAASACAAVVSDEPVGIDAEPWQRHARAVHRILGKDEAPPLFDDAKRAGLPPELATWCAKEALGKALGTGLTNLERRRVVPTGEPARWRLEGPENFHVRVFRRGESLIAVASSSRKVTQAVEIVEL